MTSPSRTTRPPASNTRRSSSTTMSLAPTMHGLPMGKPCIVGANDIVVDEERRVFEAGGRVVREGDVIAIDGETGEVILDPIERTASEVSGSAQEFLGWADRYRKLGVR